MEKRLPAGSMNTSITTNTKHMGTTSKFVRTKADVYGLNSGYVKPHDKVTETQNAVEQKNAQFVGKGNEYLITGRLILHG